MSAPIDCACECKHTRFTAHGQPLLRAFCHCTICQAFNNAPFADITLFHTPDVDMPATDQVLFNTHRPPPAVQRGVCRDCGRPAIEVLQIFPLPKLIIVPSANIRDASVLPTPSLHVFYHRRVADIDDGLPKFAGYWKSQLAFGHRVLGALRRNAAAS